jgi:hypothetical protein
MNEELYGLLGLDPEKIRQQQMTQGLLSAGLQLLAGSGYSPVRRTTGELLGQAGMAGMGAYQQAGQESIDQALRSMQVKQMMDKQKREAQFAESIRNAYRMAPSAQGVMATQSNIDPALLEGMSAEEVVAATPMTERVLDQQKFMSALAEYNPLEYAKMAFKGTEEPAQIQTLRALMKDPSLMEAFVKVEGAKRPLTSVEVKNQAARDQAMFKEIDIPIVQGFVNSATSAREFANTSNQVNDLLKGAGGGKAVQVGTDLARALNIQGGQVAAADLAQSLAVQAAVKVRPSGSGSTSNIEFDAYLKSVPSLANSEQGRALMSKYSTAFAERSAKLADYSRKLAKEDRLSFEAIQAYDQSLGPILKDDFYNFTKSATTSGTRDYRNR